MNIASWILLGIVALLGLLLVLSRRDAREAWLTARGRKVAIDKLTSEKQSAEARLRNANRNLTQATDERDRITRLWTMVPVRVQAIAQARVTREDEVAALKAQELATAREAARQARVQAIAEARKNQPRSSAPARRTSSASSSSDSFATAAVFAASTYVDSSPSSCDVSVSVDCGGM